MLLRKHTFELASLEQSTTWQGFGSQGLQLNVEPFITNPTLEKTSHFWKTSLLCSHFQFMSSIGLAGLCWAASPMPPLFWAHPCLESFGNLGTATTWADSALTSLSRSQGSAHEVMLVCRRVQCREAQAGPVWTSSGLETMALPRFLCARVL